MDAWLVSEFNDVKIRDYIPVDTLGHPFLPREGEEVISHGQVFRVDAISWDYDTHKITVKATYIRQR